MPSVVLSKDMSRRVHELVQAFLSRGRNSPTMKGEFLLMLQSIAGMIEDDITFDQVEIDVVVYLLDCYFSAFDSEDVDPLAEQAYAKLTGYWPEVFSAPWYDRCIQNEHVVGYQRKKSSREPLGY